MDRAPCGRGGGVRRHHLAPQLELGRATLGYARARQRVHLGAFGALTLGCEDRNREADCRAEQILLRDPSGQCLAPAVRAAELEVRPRPAARGARLVAVASDLGFELAQPRVGGGDRGQPRIGRGRDLGQRRCGETVRGPARVGAAQRRQQRPCLGHLGAEGGEINPRPGALGLGRQHVLQPAVGRLVARARRLDEPIHRPAMRIREPHELAREVGVGVGLPRCAVHLEARHLRRRALGRCGLARRAAGEPVRPKQRQALCDADRLHGHGIRIEAPGGRDVDHSQLEHRGLPRARPSHAMLSCDDHLAPRLERRVRGRDLAQSTLEVERGGRLRRGERASEQPRDARGSQTNHDSSSSRSGAA